MVIALGKNEEEVSSILKKIKVGGKMNVRREVIVRYETGTLRW